MGSSETSYKEVDELIPKGAGLDRYPDVRWRFDPGFTERIDRVVNGQIDRGEVAAREAGYAVAFRLGLEVLEREAADPNLLMARLERENLELLAAQDAERDAAAQRARDLAAATEEQRRQAEAEAKRSRELAAKEAATAAKDAEEAAAAAQKQAEADQRQRAEERKQREARLAELRAEASTS